MVEHLLILTIGLPCSGKSTWARSQDWPIVCPDEIRKAIHGQAYVQSAEPLVWAIARYMVEALFGAGHRRVILDACNHTPERRAEWRDDDEWRLAYKTFEVDKETCVQRARNAGRYDLVKVIDRMSKVIKFPDDEEYEHG